MHYYTLQGDRKNKPRCNYALFVAYLIESMALMRVEMALSRDYTGQPGAPSRIATWLAWRRTPDSLTSRIGKDIRQFAYKRLDLDAVARRFVRIRPPITDNHRPHRLWWVAIGIKDFKTVSLIYSVASLAGGEGKGADRPG